MQVKTNLTPFARLRTLPPGTSIITGGFWERKQTINRHVTLRHGYQMLEKAGNFDNFRVAAGLTQGKYKGLIFNDSDVYKWLEAVACDLALHPDAELEKTADDVISLLVTTQEKNGYLNSHFQTTGKERFSDLEYAHELYCAGHLIEAAIAHRQATGKHSLLEVARRFADHLDSVFGPDKHQGTSGHPEIELALVELYRETRERRYLDLALFFVNQRGQGKMRGFGRWGPAYHQDRVPIREAVEVEGHAVRQLYLNSGVTDLYLETGEQALLEAMLRLWQDMTTRKMYLTGGFGARHSGESFGEAHELPSRSAYCETCAAIAAMMWNWRMLLATGKPHFADILERSLYNGFLSGWSLDGRRFFYVNPLESLGRVERQEWYECACCPPNVMRQVATVGHYLATTSTEGIQIHHFTSARLAAAINGSQKVVLSLSTDYPWNGRIQVTVEETEGGPWILSLRIPAWSSNAQVSVNGRPAAEPAGGTYAMIERAWQPGDMIELDLPMTPRLIRAHPYVDDLRGCVAIERGPLVYCFEAIDQEAGLNLRHTSLSPEVRLQAHWRGDLLGGVVTVEADGLVSDLDNWTDLYLPQELAHVSQRPVRLIAVPYFAWANRGPGALRVWIPCQDSGWD
ncbi:MAG: glycoside hydrolase family 127 protein [Chloroflexi bacterium]|nr:glycoside hydrolase family 127 protein [Chloroflexota bacterium]MCI0645304.1 glycoside hydrolase family 127 protein [Chloroflexota bacterium]MCI0729542.1 glycoside hydrolase family 127 protein [Chloroflexota bacterium]